MGRVEELAIRLAAIHDQLSRLEGASAERYQLLKERDDLRDEAAGLAVDVDLGRSTEDLEAELSALVRRRKGLVDARTGYAMAKGGNNSGPASAAWVALSVASHAGAGVGTLNVRISRIEDVLASRRGIAE